jgi:ABC-type lipoprotein export system ATPase subunit
MVTHEDDIAQTAKKKVLFKDGKMIQREDTVNRIIASEQLLRMPKPEEVII